jgi:hypothetical protein
LIPNAQRSRPGRRANYRSEGVSYSSSACPLGLKLNDGRGRQKSVHGVMACQCDPDEKPDVPYNGDRERYCACQQAISRRAGTVWETSVRWTASVLHEMPVHLAVMLFLLASANQRPQNGLLHWDLWTANTVHLVQLYGTPYFLVEIALTGHSREDSEQPQ